MIKTDFRYKPFYGRITLKGYFHKKLEKLLFYLYENKIYKKLKLNKNEMLRHTVEVDMKSKNFYKIFTLDLPEDLEIKPHSFTFLDAIEIENINIFKSELITLTSKYDSGFLSGQPNSEISKSLERFTSEYKGSGWGKIYFNNLRKVEKPDLIDGISYQYIKGEQSHLIISYTVFPSTKFKNIFREILKIPPTEKHTLGFYSFKRALKKRRLVSSIQHSPVFAADTLTKLYNEINFQCKEFLSDEISCGIFLQSQKYLFPSIICHTYNPELYNKYSKEYLNLLNFERNSNYFDAETKQLFSAPGINLTSKAAEYFQYFIPFQTEIEEKKDQFSSVNYLSDNYAKAFAASWFLPSLAAYLKTRFVKNRIDIFKYMAKNNDTLFLKKSLSLKRKLSRDWFTLNRLSNDFSPKIIHQTLYSFGIPNALKEERLKGEVKTELKKDLVVYGKHLIEDLKLTFSELQEVLKQISEDNNTRSNMRLQLILLILAILGIILTIYSSNSNYFNGWLKYFITQILHFKIPHPQS